MYEVTPTSNNACLVCFYTSNHLKEFNGFLYSLCALTTQDTHCKLRLLFVGSKELGFADPQSSGMVTFGLWSERDPWTVGGIR